MNEHFVAINRQSLYPEVREADNVPEVVTAKRIAEKSKSPHKEHKKVERKHDHEPSRRREEEERRVRDLERELKESTISTAKAVREATAIIERAAGESVKQREAAPEVKHTEGPTIVSYPDKPLEFLSRDEVAEIFNSQGVRKSPPSDWDPWSPVKRRLWLEKNQILETIQFPESDVLYKDDEHNAAVVKVEDGYQLYGLDDLEPETVKTFLEKAGVDVDLAEPDDWRQKSPAQKIQWYKEAANLEVTTGLAIGGAKWPNNYLVDAHTAGERLKELDAEKEANPVNFHTKKWESDMEELVEHLRNLKTGRPNEILQRLIRNPGDSGMKKALEFLFEHARECGDSTHPKFEVFESRFVFNLDETIKDFVARAEGSGQMDLIDSIIDPNDRTEISNLRDQINGYFKQKEKDKQDEDPQGLAKLYVTLEQNLAAYYKSLQSGWWPDIAEAEQKTFETVARESHRELLRGEQGLLAWRAVVQIENMRRSHQAGYERATPLDWKEAMTNTKRNLLFIESQDAPSAQIEDAIRRVVGIADDLTAQIPKLEGDDKEKAENMLKDINEYKDSVVAIYNWRTTMEGESMNPEKVLATFGSPLWKDVTFKYYFKRFAKDHLDREFTDHQGQQFNLLDKAMSMYFKRFREERLRMNKIEELTLGELDPNSADQDERWIADWMQTRGYDLKKEWGRNMAHTEQAIAEWYRQNTLLGAHGVDNNSRDLLDLRRVELREALIAELKKGIQGLLPQTQELTRRIEEFEQSGLLKQVTNNAYNLTFAMGAFSEYDIIRIWDREKNWFGGRKRLGEVVKSQDSRRWWGWHVDHYAEFLHFEPRGRAGRFGRNLDTNYILQKHMMGKRRNILPNNRLLVKLINDNLSNEKYQLSLDMTGNDLTLEKQINQKIANLENHESLDIGTLSGDLKTWDHGAGDDRGFAKGWATAELIDFGDVSFENVHWSEVFDVDDPNISKFNMGDWWFDRMATGKAFAPNMMQRYLQTPNTKQFFEVNSDENFYSKREIRLKPWMKLVMPAHFEIGKWWRKWYKLPYNMSHAEKEQVVDYSAQTNRIDAKYHHELKIKHLGWGPSWIPVLGQGGWTVRHLRDWAEAAHVATLEVGKGSWTLPFLYILEFFKQAFGQVQAQLAGK
ncbi:hypothetical protein A3B52_00140 [Candidatus Curtissbacteria bacterium RIFCSPLOWO2_01_FULL_41_28]|uniref:Uncharacterized protein n=1 Tax=Candidatus Curtissbacteria bacterium RIFOXYA1_FULL_41_14 TaxID=1797737 RepID=A0A1F5HD42_9BACT|nr:MAG: hypothetical protein A3B52_00140 [Candidatus Curtissbacteria bacterium RIFCSPLOWO2_01_FULL_41_28]OGE02010.1 MAG: hypothetical protein A2196_03920 [Candidatus Curtissbacteria bacterium RIFOXYA1_FULL_41_14]OGE05852.1 MAG: hypothetical protein A2362_04015 [Candidatus Curtissbacteria bacterium RIFOXYB1_FULL_41_59]OGE07508.1 MAG: hypothetical protein A2615_03335 [Candidatus Curtissbacteria bacterium RIFOXYD1_FULL_41_36]OGE15675.1 MAG: hypothetical protein A2409_00590 [Candidatus Curtissbacte